MMVAGKGLRTMEKKAQANFSYVSKVLPKTLSPTLLPSFLLDFFLNVTDVVLLSHEGENVSSEGQKNRICKEKSILEESEARNKFPFATSARSG